MMRDPKRLDRFYITMGGLHKTYCPDLRFGQLMYNFIKTYGDPFYWEEDELLEKFKEYVESMEYVKP